MEGALETAEQMAEDLRNKRDEARDSIIVAQRKQKKYYDVSKGTKEFEVGDLILLKFNRFAPGYRAPKNHNHKLAPLATPLRITEKLSPLSYRVALPTGSKIHDVISIAHLRRYRGTTDDIRTLPVTVEDKEEYEVERIDGERINTTGSVEYLVKWLGYGENERTWEPASHLQHTDEIIATWRANRPDNTPSSRSKPTRRSGNGIGERRVTRSQAHIGT
jgi:hypothetical protein